MDDRGATVQLSLADRHIVFRDGRRVPIRGVDGLPMIDVLFYENPGLGSETTSESAGCLAADAETKEDGESGTRSSGSKIAIGSRRHVLRSMGRKALTKRQQEDMLRHRRCGHFHIPGSDNASEFNGEKSGWVNFCGKQKPPILVRDQAGSA
eukprot:gene86-220_t